MSSISLFGAIRHTNTQTHLENESFIALFGSITIDLTHQPLNPGEHTINAFAMFGEVTIRVPDSIGVHVDGGALMGETRYERRTAENKPLSSVEPVEVAFESAPVRLRITAAAILGAVRIVRIVDRSGKLESTAVDTPTASDTYGAYEGETRKIASM